MDTSSGHDCSSTGTSILSDTTSIAPGLVYTFTETLSTPGYYCAQVILGKGSSDPGVSMYQPFSVTSSASSGTNVIVAYQVTTETTTALSTLLSTETTTQLNTATLTQTQTTTSVSTTTAGLAPGIDPSLNTLILAIVFLIGALTGFLLIPVLRKKQKPLCSKCKQFKLVGEKCAGCEKPEANCTCSKAGSGVPQNTSFCRKCGGQLPNHNPGCTMINDSKNISDGAAKGQASE